MSTELAERPTTTASTTGPTSHCYCHGCAPRPQGQLRALCGHLRPRPPGWPRCNLGESRPRCLVCVDLEPIHNCLKETF
jgi:hypothetical protein